MKYVYKIIPGVILFMGLAGACKDDDSTSIPGGIAVDREEITIGPEGGTEQIAVTSYSNWVAGASKPWIFVSPANGSSSAECQLAIDSALDIFIAIFCPSNRISPLVASSSMASSLPIVDFPQPFAPMMIVIIPFGIFKFISSMIMRSSYAAKSPFTSIAFIVSKSLLLLPHQVYKIRYTNQRHRNSRRDFDW